MPTNIEPQLDISSYGMKKGLSQLYKGINGSKVILTICPAISAGKENVLQDCCVILCVESIALILHSHLYCKVYIATIKHNII